MKPVWTVEDIEKLRSMEPAEQAAFKRVLMARLDEALAD